MKSERLLSLMILLANHESVTAPGLARRFGVSVRTIYRDIAALSASGVPVITETGRSGGISLIKEFRIDRNVVKPTELGHVLSGLQGLATAVSDPVLQESLEKYRNLVPRPSRQAALSAPRPLELHMELAPSRRERDTIDTIRQAAVLGRLLAIEYGDASGRQTLRTVEPYALVFQWSAWYLYAWCRLRGEYRNFKLARISRAEQLGERFVTRQPDLASRPWKQDWESLPFDDLVLRFSPGARLAVQEHFEPEQICPEADGASIVRVRLPVDEWVVSFLAGFGGKLEVLAPPALRERMRRHAEEMLAHYRPAGFTPNPDTF
jgi:predicted DNA-binding transcriptional regulator YafY